LHHPQSINHLGDRKAFQISLCSNKIGLHFQKDLPKMTMLSENESLTVGIVGAGLAGTMVAVLLENLGLKVTVFERRLDQRKDTTDLAGEFGASTSALKRSINLALSYRGQIALKELGILEEAMSDAIRMPCRVIHSVDGKVVQQQYGTPDEAIWSVGREKLNHLLLDRASRKESKVTVKFGYSLISADSKSGHCTFQNSNNSTVEEFNFDLVIGSDGAYSSLRECMLKQGRINFSRSYIAHGYKELSIPPIQNANGESDFALKNHEGLHIWPRGEFMMIALPNPDKSFTATLFAPYKGEFGFDHVDPKDPIAINKYFSTHFPDVLALMPDISNDYCQNPVGSLLTVRVAPWNCGKLLLLGDAAHAVVPFYGQGMNAAFEDGLRLYQVVKKQIDELRKTNDGEIKVDLSISGQEFSDLRVASANALADLCIEHYDDMASNTSSTVYVLKIQIGASLANVSEVFPAIVQHGSFQRCSIPRSRQNLSKAG
jgi:kynurenine 3-monooxygenase